METCNVTRLLSFVAVLLVSAAILSGQAKQGVGDDASKGEGMPIQSTVVQAPPESLPNPPTVVCNGDQLTISTNNSTLASVLAEVHKCIGTKIDMPDVAGANRLFDKLGPGPAREVLTSLLTATGFDYVIGSPEADPNKVETVLLMVRAVDTNSSVRADNTVSPARRAYMLMRQNARSGVPADESGPVTATAESDTTAKDDKVAAVTDSTAADASQTPLGDQAPSAVDGVPASRVSSNADPSPTSSTPAQSSDTHEQITNMEKLFEQRRQMMLNQNSQSPK